MILVIDVGNTNITFGVYESKKLVTTFRMTSRTMRTSDEYGTEILAMLQNNQIDRRKVGGAIIASVVPKVMHALSSMQAGLVYGQIGQTEYIINQVKKETGITDLKVVATGGLGRIIADETDTIDIYDSALTLDGLRILYEKNCSGK